MTTEQHKFSRDSRDTLFVADLPSNTTREDVEKLFSGFGEIIKVTIKLNGGGKPRYCFVRFSSKENASNAYRVMNGTVFEGRELRLGWANDKRHVIDKPVLKSAQVMVSFISKQVEEEITSGMLKEIFGRFGDVSKTSLKKCNVNQESNVQSGFGFVDYPPTDEGINSALNAIRAMKHATIGAVTYDCNCSDTLNAYLSESLVSSFNSFSNNLDIRPLDLSSKSFSSQSGSLTSSESWEMLGSGSSMTSPTAYQRYVYQSQYPQQQYPQQQHPQQQYPQQQQQRYRKKSPIHHQSSHNVNLGSANQLSELNNAMRSMYFPVEHTMKAMQQQPPFFVDNGGMLMPMVQGSSMYGFPPLAVPEAPAFPMHFSMGGSIQMSLDGALWWVPNPASSTASSPSHHHHTSAPSTLSAPLHDPMQPQPQQQLY